MGYVTSAKDSQKTTTIKVKYDFHPPPNVVYESLLDTNRIRGITASDASMSTEVGGKFSMFSGAVEGENIALTPFKRESNESAVIKWKWRFSTWQPGVHSTVTITLEENKGGTRLELVQTGVPAEECERTEKGWTGEYALRSLEGDARREYDSVGRSLLLALLASICLFICF